LKVTAEQAREAEEYLGRYLAAAQPRLEWLRELAVRTGGPTADQLSYGRDSLVPLWTWARGQFKLRPQDAQLDFVEKDGHRYYVPRHGDVPMWYGRRGVQAPHHWSDETLQLIDALVYYLAECLLRAVPGSRWEIFHAAVRNHIDENQPVLTGFGQPVELIMPMMNVTGGVWRDMNPDEPNPYRLGGATPDDLQKWYDALVDNAPRA
jgi:hypothetical protein